MSQPSIDDCIRRSVEQYLRDLGHTEPQGIYDMILKVVEKPLLEVIMAHTGGNQFKTAAWLGIHRNTLRRKLIDHDLLP